MFAGNGNITEIDPVSNDVNSTTEAQFVAYPSPFIISNSDRDSNFISFKLDTNIKSNQYNVEIFDLKKAKN